MCSLHIAHHAKSTYRDLDGTLMMACLDLAAHLTKGVFRDADATGLGDAFKPGSDIDAVAEDVVALDQHVAEMDAGCAIPCGARWGFRHSAPPPTVAALLFFMMRRPPSRTRSTPRRQSFLTIRPPCWAISGSAAARCPRKASTVPTSSA